MIDLNEIITKYPECMESAEKLRAYLGDLYPAEKARINVLSALMSIGAAEEIRNTEKLDKLVVSNYCSRLLNEYGYSEALSAECVELWHTTYVKRQVVQASTQIAPAAKTSGFYAKVAGVTFEGRQSFIAEMHRKGSTALTLERDRNNPYDVNAIAVINEHGWQIGYLPRDIAAQIAPQMDAGIQVTAKVSAINIGEAGYNSGVSIYIEVGGGRTTAEEKGEAVNQRKRTTPLNEFEIEDGVLVKYIGTAVNVVVPDCVTAIGEEAFSPYNSLEISEISGDVTTLDEYSSRELWSEEDWMYNTVPVIYDETDDESNGVIHPCYFIENIEIPGSVTRIEAKAFSGCHSLKKIIIHHGVTAIGESAFAECTSLQHIELPDSVETIEDSAFYRCESLNKMIIHDGVTMIGDCAFEYCSALQHIAIPNSVIAIGHSAFHDCCELERIELPIGIEAISPSVFYDCTSLMSAKISNSVTTIGEAAFYNCGVLTGITIPESVTTIGDEAFLGCSSLRDIIIPSEISSIGYHAFEKTAWLEAQPDGIIYIGNLLYGIKGKCPSQIKTRPGAVGWDNLHFDNCTSLESIEIPDGVKIICSEAFFRCTALKNVSFPDGLTTISEKAFFHCTSLGKIVFPDSLTTIEEKAFLDCTSLTSIVLPDSVTSLGDAAFQHCTALERVTLSAGLTSISPRAFFGCQALETVEIPDGVTEIGEEAFNYCPSLKSIEIPNGVIHIADRAFLRCTSLESIIIPNSVTTIGIDAFKECSSLTIKCNRGSYAEQYAKENGIDIEYLD